MNKKAIEMEMIPKVILYPAILIIILLMMYIFIKYLVNDLDLSDLFKY